MGWGDASPPPELHVESVLPPPPSSLTGQMRRDNLLLPLHDQSLGGGGKWDPYHHVMGLSKGEL